MMRQVSWAFAIALLLSGSQREFAQTHKATDNLQSEQAPELKSQECDNQSSPALDAQREKRALQILLKSVQKKIVSTAEAMPADKYGFAPTEGEFKGVRTFGQQVKHLAATNYILAAAALGEAAPADAGDEAGPENVRTKAEILEYLSGSFTRLEMALNAIGDKNVALKSSPISPLSATTTTRLALTVESLLHSLNHYGQMVGYLRMNGVVPPAVRREECSSDHDTSR